MADGTLSELAAGCPKLALPVGTTITAEELAGVELALVEEGLVVLRSVVPGSARRAILCHAGAGAVILPPGRGEVLVALSDAEVTTISDAALNELLARPETSRVFIDGLAETLRQKHAALAGMSRLHHVDRVREKLMQLARDHGRVGRDGIRLDFPLTHDLLAEMTGSARETVTRALDELQREGFVGRQGRTYSVHVSPDELGVRPLTMRR